MLSKQKIIICLFLLTITVALTAPIGFLYAVDPPPAPAPAARTYVPLAPLPEPPSGSGIIATTDTDLAKYLKKFFWFSIVAAGVLAVLMITKGGVLYMTSEAFNTKAEAKTQITMAIVGFLLAISSVLILTTVNPDLLKFNLLVRPLIFTIPDIPTSSSIDGCTNLVTSPTNRCLWVTSTFATCQDTMRQTIGPLVRDDFRNGADSYCAGTKPTDLGTKCCQWSAPKNGCSGAGNWAGKTKCQWSTTATPLINDCPPTPPATSPVTPPDTALVDSSDTLCSGASPGIGANCCTK